MEAIHDFDQLQLHFVDHVQWRYELIRPVVLIGSRTAAQRAEETHTHPDTVRKLTRRFRQQGTLGLIPEHTEMLSPSRGKQVPEAVVEALARLKALYTRLGRLAEIRSTSGGLYAGSNSSKMSSHLRPRANSEATNRKSADHTSRTIV
jgi:hypothetical protein